MKYTLFFTIVGLFIVLGFGLYLFNLNKNLPNIPHEVLDQEDYIEVEYFQGIQDKNEYSEKLESFSENVELKLLGSCSNEELNDDYEKDPCKIVDGNTNEIFTTIVRCKGEEIDEIRDDKCLWLDTEVFLGDKNDDFQNIIFLGKDGNWVYSFEYNFKIKELHFKNRSFGRYYVENILENITEYPEYDNLPKQIFTEELLSSCDEYTIEKNLYLRSRYWLDLTSVDLNPEIISYRIRWFNGDWSEEYIPGVNDKDQNINRWHWAHFKDHDHYVLKCEKFKKLYSFKGVVQTTGLVEYPNPVNSGMYDAKFQLVYLGNVRKYRYLIRNGKEIDIEKYWGKCVNLYGYLDEGYETINDVDILDADSIMEIDESNCNRKLYRSYEEQYFDRDFEAIIEFNSSDNFNFVQGPFRYKGIILRDIRPVYAIPHDYKIKINFIDKNGIAKNNLPILPSNNKVFIDIEESVGKEVILKGEVVDDSYGERFIVYHIE